MTVDNPAADYGSNGGIVEFRFNRLNALDVEVAQGFAVAVKRAIGEPWSR
jgi:hypothetical protein